MSYEPPTPPAKLPTEIVNTLNDSTPEQLQEITTYAEALAEQKERGAHLEESADQNEVVGRPMTSRTTSLPKRQSRSRRSTTIATTTGSGGRAVK